MGNLNFFFAYSSIVFYFSMMVLLTGQSTSSYVLNTGTACILSLLPLLLIIGVWMKWGLVPNNVSIERKSRNASGQGLVATGSGLIWGTVALPLLLAEFYNPSFAYIAWFGILTVPVTLVLWLVGAIMVYSSRQKST